MAEFGGLVMNPEQCIPILQEATPQFLGMYTCDWSPLGIAAVALVAVAIILFLVKKWKK